MTTTEQSVTVEGAEPEALPATVPAILGDAMAVSPAAMRAELTAQVRRYVSAVREQRGPVRMREDTYPLLRTLAGGADALKAYGRVIRDLEMEVRTHAEDEAVEAVGEAEGVPTTKSWQGDAVPFANVTVPDAEGDWHLTRDFDTVLDVDWQSLISVEARLTSAHVMGGVAKGVPTIDGVLDAIAEAESDPRQRDGDTPTQTEVLEELVSAVAQHAAEATLERLLFLSSAPKPKSTALKAWAKELSRKGLDDLGSIVSSAWSSARAYRGVSVSRS